MKNKKLILFLLIITTSLFASQNALQFKVVPFDYSDEDMKEQLCVMIRDDKEMAHWMKKQVVKYIMILLHFDFCCQ